MRYHIAEAIQGKQASRQKTVEEVEEGHQKNPFAKPTAQEKDLMLLFGGPQIGNALAAKSRQARAFSAVIDAFNDEVSLTQKQGLCKPKLPQKADKKSFLSLDNSDEILDIFPKA